VGHSTGTIGQHKSTKKMVSHSAFREYVFTRNQHREAKLFSSAPTITLFTHRHTGIQWWERNEGILTSNFEVSSCQKRKK